MPAMSTAYTTIQAAAVKGEPTLTNITATATRYCEDLTNTLITCIATPTATTRVYVKTVATATENYQFTYWLLPATMGMTTTSYMRVQ